jgi:hypothetical protein
MPRGEKWPPTGIRTRADRLAALYIPWRVCARSNCRVKTGGEVGRDVAGAPVRVLGGSGGPAPPDKREPHNPSSYWGASEPACGRVCFGSDWGGKPGGNGRPARFPTNNTGGTPVPPAQAENSIELYQRPLAIRLYAGAITFA